MLPPLLLVEALLLLLLAKVCTCPANKVSVLELECLLQPRCWPLAA
jgi:hypothetical protein